LVVTFRNLAAANKNKMLLRGDCLAQPLRRTFTSSYHADKEHIRARIGFPDGHGFAVAFIRGGTNMTRTKMRKELLLGTVALMAGIGLASAQGLREGGSAGGSERGLSSGSSQVSPGSGAAQGGSETRGEGAADHKARSQSDRQMNREHVQGEGSKKGTSGQASDRQEKSTTGQGSAEKSESTKGSASKEESNSKNANKAEGKHEGMANSRSSAQDSKKNDKSTTGQASPDKNERSTAGQGSRDRNEGSKAESQEKSPSSQPAQKQTQTPETGKQNQTTGSATQGQQNTQQSGASVQSQAGTTITAQQQTTIQQSVLSARNVPRVNNVNFAIRTNTVVPTSVHVVGVSTFPALVEVFPRYRDDSFFVVEDEIVIVDRGHRIVDVVPAGPRAHFGRAGSTTTTSTTVNLSEPEIREVQQVLIDRGFFHGRVDGVFGPETREALISFQRKEGFEATGSVDTRTVGALGLSARIGGNVQGDKNQSGQNQSGMQRPSGQSGTSGQAPASQQNGSSGQTNPPAQNQSQNQPTKDQSNPSAQKQPSANDERSQNSPGGSAPSTTGQGNTESQTSGSPQKRNPSDR
jgi:peptidoglycan hydrolase-like protein with peptidoglycan-binding domain